nr:MAG TPA: hypothetical protein [Caudoviricetes sp.]
MIWPIIYTHLRHWANELDDRGHHEEAEYVRRKLGGESLVDETEEQERAKELLALLQKAEEPGRTREFLEMTRRLEER